MERLYYSIIEDNLDNEKICLLIGARQVGKTTLVKQLHEKFIKEKKASTFINLENKNFKNLLNQDPENIFQLIPPITSQSRQYVIIDEIQYLADPSNFLKYIYDEYHNKIKLIVTGSSSFYIDRKFNDSLSGRKRLFEIAPFSFREMLLFNDREDLANCINSDMIPLVLKNEIMKYFFEFITFGGYPEVVLEKNADDKIAVLKEIGESYVKKDIVEAEIKKPEQYLKLFRLLAERSGSFTNIHSISNDLGIAVKTVENYLWTLRKSFHVHLITPFFNNISSEFRKTPKVYLNDLGLRNYLLRNFSPIGSREDKGEILENYVFLSLKDKYPIENIKFWRTQKKQEVDFVVSDFYGNSKAIEVKYSNKNFQIAKYHYFKKKYPNIPLRCVSLENILTLNN